MTRSVPFPVATDLVWGADALPLGVAPLLAEHGVAPDALRVTGKLGLRRPVTRLTGAGVVVELAESEEGRRRIRREVWGRAWADRVGVPTAAIHGADPAGGWLVGEWIAPGAASGASYLDCAIEVAGQIAAASPPLAGPQASVWRSPRRAALIRTGRAVAARMPMRLWWAARAAARTLPQVPVAHGDYYHRNVLWRPEGELCVVDWEYLGAGPRHGDLLRLWTILPDRADRDTLLDRILTTTPAAQHREVAALGLWLALRLLGENLKAAREDRNDADLTHAWSIQPEARILARTHDAWPL